MEHNYSKREIDAKFDNLDEKLDKILDQTTKTNGRVTSLERYRYILAGGLAVVTALFVPVVIAVTNRVL